MRRIPFKSVIGSLLLLTLPLLASAHSGMDRPLFVSADGIDEGRCLDPAAPCRSIGYALGRVGKGGEVRVAVGRYELSDVADLFHIISGIVAVRGGYSTGDRFARPGDQPSIVTGVPPAYRSLFASRGFHVLADSKGQPQESEIRARQLLKLHDTLQVSQAAAPCVNGTAGNLVCDRVGLLAHVPFAEVSARPRASADVWGFVDLNTNREYAIVAFNIGTAVFDVTNPEQPREVGFVDGQNTTWRDVKVFQYFDATAARWNAYAYVTTDGSTEGLFVIDLTQLPQRIRRLAYGSDFSAAHNVYISDTDYGTGLALTDGAPTLIVSGSNTGGGQFRSYSLDNPAAPLFLGPSGASNSDYIHDAASSTIVDTRKDTQCVNAVDYCTVLFDFNESTVDIWDISDRRAPVRLSRTPYDNAQYTHSGWPSEDGRFLFVHDELDEQGLGLRTTVRTFSLDDLRAPVLVGTWTGPTAAIDHNGFVRGNRYYMSNYTRGLTILDISNPAAALTAGFMDTYPFSDNASFVGAWGAYPFFHSGTIAVSDISSGLYLLSDNSLDVPAGSLSFTASSFGGEEGQDLLIEVQRNGGSSGAVSVELQTIPGSAGRDDLLLPDLRLDWADGDTTPRAIRLGADADGIPEGLERLLLKLVSPTGGATIQAPAVASVYVSDPGETSTVQFSRNEVTALERGFGLAVVTLQRLGNASGDISVNYALDGGDALAGVDYEGVTAATINWSDGDADPRNIEFLIANDNEVEADEFFELVLSSPRGAVLGVQASTRITLLDGSGSNSAPNALAGASQTASPGATLTLAGNNSNDPDGDTLDFIWTQIMGPLVTLAGADSATATFTAPAVQSDTLFQFQLTVTDPLGLTDTATTNVTVNAANNAANGDSGGGGRLDLALLCLLWLLTLTRYRRTFTRRDGA